MRMYIISGDSRLQGASPGLTGKGTRRYWSEALLVAALMLLRTTDVASSTPDALQGRRMTYADFQVSEGTFTSLDVSPDGKTIVFDLLGGLYLLPIEGGTARPLTDGLAYDQMPSYSPDGSRILFLSDREGASNLWTIAPDGTRASRLTSQMPDHRPTEQYFFPRWAPDGLSVVFGRLTAFDWPIQITRLWLSNGQQEDLKLTGGEFGPISPTFSPEGRYVYYSTGLDCAIEVGYQDVGPCSQLHAWDTYNRFDSIQSYPQGGGVSPLVSPNGRWLVYATRFDADTGLVLRDRTSGNERRLAFPVDHDIQDSVSVNGALPASAFTPDSLKYVTSIDGKIVTISLDDGRITNVPFVARVRRELRPLLVFQKRLPTESIPIRYIRSPRISPDYKQLLFVAGDKIWIMDAKSGRLHRATRDSRIERFASWTPDGRDIVYSAWSAQEGGNVYRVSAGTSPSTGHLISSTPGDYVDVEMSPDKEWIAATRGVGPEEQGQAPLFDIVSIPTRGGPTTYLTTANHAIGLGHSPQAFGETTLLHFASGSDRVYFMEPRAGLVSVDHGMHRRCLEMTLAENFDGLTNTKWRWQGYEIIPGPDPSRYILRFQRHVYLLEDKSLRTAPGSCETRTIDIGAPNSPFVARRLSQFGGLFPSWTTDARGITYALGATVFLHDVTSSALNMREGSTHDLLDGSNVHTISVVMNRNVDHPKGTILLRDARVLTMNGDEILDHHDVLIEDDRIAAIGPTGTLLVPPSAKLFDLAGATVMPGMIDTHCHVNESRATPRPDERGPWQLMNLLAYGVTTCEDPFTAEGEFEAADRIASGEFVGSRLLSTGPGITWDEVLRSEAEADDILLRDTRFSHAELSKYYLTGNRAQQQWLFSAADRHQQTVLSEGEFFGYDITNVLDGVGGMAHSIGLPYLHDDVHQLLRSAGTVLHVEPAYVGWNVAGALPFAHYLATIDVNLLTDAKAARFFPHAHLLEMTRRALLQPRQLVLSDFMGEQLKEVIDHGGKVAFGEHGEWQGIGYTWNIWAMAPSLGNHLALRVVTQMAADAIGYSADLGTIRVGKAADMIVFGADPLRDIRNVRNIRYVVKNGRVFNGDTLDQVAPDRAALPAQWWWNGEPALPKGRASIGGMTIPGPVSDDTRLRH
jgi:Tol biopolymer transport system component